MRTHMLKLKCWIRSQRARETFEVEISRSENVTALKEAIKKKNPVALRDVDPHTLDLYKPKNPIPRPYEENLSTFILSEHAELLEIVDDELSEVLSPPSKSHIHIIVDAHYPTIIYWFRGSDILQECSLQIRSNQQIFAFKEQLAHRHPDLHGRPSACIRPYKILEENVEEYLAKIDEGKPLNGRQIVSDCFADIPVTQAYCLVIQISDSNPIPKAQRRLPASSRAIAVEDLAHEGDPIKVARNDFLKARPAKAPSDASHPSAFRESQRDLRSQIRCGRPSDPEELIPATLLHPVFGQFLDDCKTHSNTTEDNVFVGKFSHAMSGLYENENERVDKINTLLADYGIGLRTKKGIRDYQLDADMSVGEYRYVIAEFKNEAAVSVSEPYMQAAAYYLEQTRTQALEHSGSPLPCFLLVFFGPYVVFAGAVWNLRPAVQVLSHPISFLYHSTDTDNQIAAARHMAAFRKAVKSLRQYYEALAVDGLPNTLSLPSLFPYPTTFTSLADNSKRTFRYRARVKDDHKLLFFGTLVGDSGSEVPICVKFVRRYSQDAHLRCAQSGFAPRLRGFEQLPGGWFMVIMDELVGYKTLDDFTGRLPESAFEDIRNQLNRLHHDGFVHGDVRDVNIMVNEDSGDTFKLMLVDFDWAGEINVARYPAYVNRNGIDRPGDAMDGETILAAHDDWMLGHIISRNSK